MAFAAASCVAASATPVRRTGPPVTLSQCNTNGDTANCCDIVTSTSNPIVQLIGGVSALAYPDLLVGITCDAIVSLDQCSVNQSPVCCSNVSQNGLVNIACVSIIP
ncbi:hypothetical protein BC826DRAFT_1034059 [Russula brevipes]|nr:hypothetical protein BC826DRAFT_1034059 [Russula brevipes]